MLLCKIFLCTNKTLEKTFVFGTTSTETHFFVLLKHQQLRSITHHLTFLELTLPYTTYFCCWKIQFYTSSPPISVIKEVSLLNRFPYFCAEGNATKLTISSFSLNANKIWKGKIKDEKYLHMSGLLGQLGGKSMKRICLYYPTITCISWSPELLWEGASWVLAKLVLNFSSENSSNTSEGISAHFYLS